jgi:hypothetical protein
MTTALSGSPGSPGYTAPPSNATEPNQGKTATGDAGTSVVGEVVKNCPWVPNPPTVTITQGWGVTDYTGEPAGHGSPHWHAGVDLGYTTGTTVEFPTIDQNALKNWLANQGINIANFFGGGSVLQTFQLGTDAIYHRGVWDGSKYAPDPEGYGDHACTVTVRASPASGGTAKGLFDVILGHGQAWLQSDGDVVRAGDHLISSDCEGNCSGPHLHFEVRPPQGAYGTDTDPWQVLINGVGSNISSPAVTDIGSDVQAAAQDISGAIGTAVSDAEKLVIGLGMSALGALMMGGGGWIGFQAVKGSMPVRTATGVARTTTRTVRRPGSGGGSRRPLTARVRPASGTGPTPEPRAPRTTPAPPRAVTPPPRPTPSAPADVGASAVAKVSRGANPSTLTAVEGAWLKAHPDQLVAALRAAGKAA